MICVIKIGGNIIDDAAQLERFIISLAKLREPYILTHGGGKIASDFSSRLGIVPNLIEGRRVTDAETLKIIVMTYAGLINKTLVSLLQKYGVNSAGFTGADANILLAKKRAAKEVDYGYVGDIISVQTDFLELCLNVGITPVIAPVTHDGNGNLLNTNADSVAANIASQLSRRHRTSLIYCFEKQGVLANSDDESSVIPSLDASKYAELLNSGAISRGMKPKLENAFYAKKNNVENVYIRHADDALNPSSGTTIL